MLNEGTNSLQEIELKSDRMPLMLTALNSPFFVYVFVEMNIHVYESAVFKLSRERCMCEQNDSSLNEVNKIVG